MGTSASASSLLADSNDNARRLVKLEDYDRISIWTPGIVPSQITYVLPPIAVIPRSTMVSVTEEATATASCQLSYKFKSDDDQTDWENEESELSYDSIHDNEEDRKPPAKESFPWYKINQAPNGVSSNGLSCYADHRKSVMSRAARTKPIRVKTTNRHDMIVGDVAVTPDRNISHHDVSIPPKTDNGNILERCMSPDLPDNDPYIGEVAWSEEELSIHEDDDDAVPPPVPK
jgi:hypothetical protein